MQRILLYISTLFYKYRYWRPVARMTAQPGVVQMDVMRRILHTNRNTHFGVKHGFSKIRNYAELKQKIPIQHHETLRPYIEAQRHNGSQALTAEPPLFYAQTSGTTDEPKYIPMTSSAVEMHRHEQSLFSYLQYRACPEAFQGKAIGIMGAAVEGQLDSGHQVGSVSGHLYQSLPKVMHSRFVLPPAVLSIKNYELKYLVILRLALAEPNITYAGSPNPSTFLRLLNILNDRREALIQSLATGIFEELERLDISLSAVLKERLRPDPIRADYISQLPELSFANVWPDLKMVTTWMGGSCGIALNMLREKLPAKTKVMELGYQSTEFRGSIALEAETGAGLPSLHHHFFEFVEQLRWDHNNAEYLTLEQLNQGKVYYVIVTTASGLYRYFMNDLVEVTGYFNATPLLRFLQKGKGVTNLTGEKLYESQVIDAIQNVLKKNDLMSSFYMLVADEQAMAYRLFLEVDGVPPSNALALASMIDAKLGALNMEYQAKRDSGRLAPLTLTWLKHGTSEAYKTACMRLGQREVQYKPTVLLYSQNLNLALNDYALTDMNGGV